MELSKGEPGAPVIGGCRKTPALPLFIPFSTSLPFPTIFNPPHPAHSRLKREKQLPAAGREGLSFPFFPLISSTRIGGGRRPRDCRGRAAGGSCAVTAPQERCPRIPQESPRMLRAKEWPAGLWHAEGLGAEPGGTPGAHSSQGEILRAKVLHNSNCLLPGGL